LTFEEEKGVQADEEEIRNGYRAKGLSFLPNTRGWLVSRAAYRLLGSPILVIVNCSCIFLAALREEAAEQENSRANVLHHVTVV
jgi:hypothetical protein